MNEWINVYLCGSQKAGLRQDIYNANDRRQITVFYLYSPEGANCLAQPMPYQLKIVNFSYPLSFSAFVRDDPIRIYGKALRSWN